MNDDMIHGQRRAALYCNVTTATITRHINVLKTLVPDVRLVDVSGRRIDMFSKRTLDTWNKARKPRGRKRA